MTRPVYRQRRVQFRNCEARRCCGSVATAAHGQGAGSALCTAFAHKYRGMPRVVGTQVANVPSIRLYTKLGFVLAKSQYVLHAHC